MDDKLAAIKKSIELSNRDMAWIQQALMSLQYQIYHDLNDKGVINEIVELKNRLTDEFYNHD